MFNLLIFNLNKIIFHSTNFLEIEKLEGGTYDIDTLLKAINTIRNWCITVGIALAGVSIVVGFVMYTVVEVEKKQQVKQGIKQTLLGIVGIIVAISLVNLIIGLFQ